MRVSVGGRLWGVGSCGRWAVYERSAGLGCGGRWAVYERSAGWAAALLLHWVMIGGREGGRGRSEPIRKEGGQCATATAGTPPP